MGGNVNITIYEESHHSFDRETQPIINENAYMLSDCRFKMKKNGTVVMNFLDIPMSTPILQKIGLYFCAERGPTFGGNSSARKKSFIFSREFMNKHLLIP